MNWNLGKSLIITIKYMKNKISEIRKEIEYIFNSQDSTHDFDHTLRVCNLALHIAKIENADLEIIEVSSLLHDIARHEQDKSKWKICHAEKWWELARSFLQKRWFEEDFIAKVVHAITCHRFRWKNIPETLEAKILFDADKLDWIWATWIWRAFLFAWEHHAKLHSNEPNISPEAEYTKEDTAYREFVVKLSKIKDKLFTTEAKRIAEWRHNFMVEFFDRLNYEIDWII